MDDYTQSELQEFIKRIKVNKTSPIFLDPIENVIRDCPDYTSKIAHPIDLLKIEDKIDKCEYSSIENFNEDVQLMITNCLTFNNFPNTWANKCGLAFQEFYNNNYQKLLLKITKHNEKKMLGKKRPNGSQNFMKSKNGTSSLKTNNNMSLSLSLNNNLSINNNSDIHNKNSLINNDKDDYSNMNSNITVLQYDDERISKSVRNLFMHIKPHLKTSEENIENVIKILIEGFSKSNKSKEDLYDIGTKFISRHLMKKDEKNKFMKDFSELIRNIKNQQKEESTKLDQKTLTIKIDLNENEANREERVKLEKIRKTVKKFTENQKIPGIYLDKEEYSIESDLKKKIYSFVMELRNKMTAKKKSNIIISNEGKLNEINESNNNISLSKNRSNNSIKNTINDNEKNNIKEDNYNNNTRNNKKEFESSFDFDLKDLD